MKELAIHILYGLLAAIAGFVFTIAWQWYQVKDWPPAVETNPYDCVLPLKESIKHRCVYSAVS